MISIRRVLGLLALAGTIGLGAESRAQARTIQPKSAGVATAVQKIQFARLLFGQEKFQNLQGRLALIQTRMDPIVARPPFGGSPLAPATPFR